MSDSKQRRMRRDFEMQQLRGRLDVGDDITSRRTLTLLAKLVDEIRELRRQVEELKSTRPT